MAILHRNRSQKGYYCLDGGWDKLIRLVTKYQIVKTKDPAIFSLVELNFHHCKDKERLS